MKSITMRLCAWDMRNVGTLMKFGTNAMPDIFVDDPKAIISLNVIDDGFPDDRYSTAGTDCFDREVQTIKCALSYLTRFVANI